MQPPELPRHLQTQRCTLRPHRLTDAEAVFEFATDPDWARFLPVPHPYERQHADQFVARQLLKDWTVTPSWAIVVGDTLVGGIDLRLDHENRVGEVGYSLARPLWGRGLMTESVRAVFDATFRILPDLNRIRAFADARNAASLRVMAKLGMRREGLLRQNRIVRGELIDEVWCGLLREELPPP